MPCFMTGKVRRGIGQLNVAAHHLKAFSLPNIVLGIEINHLAAEWDQVGSFKKTQPPHTATACTQRGPKGRLADTDGTYHPDSRNYNVLLMCHTLMNYSRSASSAKHFILSL